jgi:hypothetical protein
MPEVLASGVVTADHPCPTDRSNTPPSPPIQIARWPSDIVAEAALDQAVPLGSGLIQQPPLSSHSEPAEKLATNDGTSDGAPTPPAAALPTRWPACAGGSELAHPPRTAAKTNEASTAHSPPDTRRQARPTI